MKHGLMKIFGTTWGLAALLLVLASISCLTAAWYYEKEFLTVEGTVKPAGFEEATVSFEVYAGTEHVENTTVHAVIPEYSDITFYISDIENETLLEDFYVTVYLLGEGPLGNITLDQNVTLSLPEGEYDFVFEIHAKASADVTEESTFIVKVAARCEGAAAP